jgi:hypothetical protein
MSNKVMAEQATGCVESRDGIGPPYNIRGEKMDWERIREHMREGEPVSVPNAGAGSYKEVLKLLGFSEVEVFEWSSSAGDWTFAVRGPGGWYAVWQSNRYPYHGFDYAVMWDHPFGTKDECFAYLAGGE